MNLRLLITSAILGVCAALAIAQSKDKTPPALGSQTKPAAQKPAKPGAKPLPDDIKTALREQHAELDPFTLKAAIEQKLKVIFSSITVSSNVRQRL